MTLTNQVPKCTFRLARDSTMHFVMFSIDITLFYLIPLVLSVVLYTLISIMLLFNGPRTFTDGTSRNRARLQVARETLYFYVEAGTVDDRSVQFPARIETSISFNINLTLHFQPGSGFRLQPLLFSLGRLSRC